MLYVGYLVKIKWIGPIVEIEKYSNPVEPEKSKKTTVTKITPVSPPGMGFLSMFAIYIFAPRAPAKTVR